MVPTFNGKGFLDGMKKAIPNDRIWHFRNICKLPKLAEISKIFHAGGINMTSIEYNNAAGVRHIAQFSCMARFFVAGNETTVEAGYKKIVPVPNTVEPRYNDTKWKILDTRSHASLLCHKTRNGEKTSVQCGLRNSG